MSATRKKKGGPIRLAFMTQDQLTAFFRGLEPGYAFAIYYWDFSIRRNNRVSVVAKSMLGGLTIWTARRTIRFFRRKWKVYNRYGKKELIGNISNARRIKLS